MTTTVFLHIPKTAGQTVHSEIARVIGAERTSPVRLHTQADGAAQYPPGYDFYSGHLDWDHLDALPADRFVFSVLRDPRERIASFYFHLLHEAQSLTEAQLAMPGFAGQRAVLNRSADAYFFDGNPHWQKFIHDHYDNFYCSYFATRTVRGHKTIADLPDAELIGQALDGAATLNKIYSMEHLDRLEADILRILAKRVQITQTRHNVGALPAGAPRWSLLLERFADDSSAARLDRFAQKDDIFLQKLAGMSNWA